MSHTVAIKTIFKDKESFMKALESFGWKIREKTTIRTYPSDPQRNKVYDEIAVNPGTGTSYDIGLTVDDSGAITLNCDFYDGTIERSLGKQFALLKREYVLNVVRKEYEDVEIVETLPDGSIIVEGEDGF
jgi:hypothetical protein